MREAATRALVKIGDPRGQEPFIAALKEQGGHGWYEAASVLTDLGWEPDRGDTGAAYWAAKKEWAMCVEIGAPAVPILIAVFGHAAYLSDRAAAVDSLGRIREPSSVEFLISLLESPDGGVNEVAAEALGRIGDPRGAEPLVIALEDEDWHFRQAAAKALRKLGWTPDRDSTGAAYWAARGEWARCVEIGAPAVAALLNGPVRQRQDSSALVAATDAIFQIGDAAVEPLLQALMDEDSQVSQTAADVLDRLAWRPDRGTAAAAYWATRADTSVAGPPIEKQISGRKHGD